MDYVNTFRFCDPTLGPKITETGRQVMSAILERIKEDAKEALKARNSERRTFLSTLADDIKKIGQNDPKAYNRPATDADAVKILRGCVEVCNTNITALEAHGRENEAVKFKEQLELYNSYLPAETSDADIEAAIVEFIGDQEKSVKLLGKIMPVLKEKFGAGLNASKASALAKKVLGV